MLGRVFGRQAPQWDIVTLLVSPLWPEKEPGEVRALRERLEADLRGLDFGFEIWIDWYRDRLEGKEPKWEIARSRPIWSIHCDLASGFRTNACS